MIDISGRIFTIHTISPKASQVVLTKKVRGKDTAIAVEVFGFWNDKMLEMKLKKGDKIKGTLYIKSNFYKTKWYSDLYFRSIELVPPKPKKGENNKEIDELIIGDVKHFYNDKGDIIL